MKRIAILLLSLCMAATAGGCKKKGTVFTDLLPSNPTTGYDWVMADASDSTDYPGRVNVALDYILDPATEGLAGAGGHTQVTMTGGSSGKAIVQLYYVRSWEWDGDPTKAAGAASYEYKVNPDLSLELLTTNVTAPEGMKYDTGKIQGK